MKQADWADWCAPRSWERRDSLEALLYWNVVTDTFQYNNARDWISLDIPCMVRVPSSTKSLTPTMVMQGMVMDSMKDSPSQSRALLRSVKLSSHSPIPDSNHTTHRICCNFPLDA